ncbi:HAD-IA family hydrolase [Brachybacterium halotolerans subsp. kimchii]|uniref:HAD-IA family hydrolase n=1 Tax=Brachybacterium TaxID=43668 RepID=UPI001E50B8EE|nr:MULTISPECIES: HAD-IA family hydrolase [Brachybacterium]MCG7309329.1 HAD-IA family hydrolase [Brachybacterium sp. ACRRE]UEJ83696.1 HAD-IA family hydrolase [Brachybacterium halotolerans subsp. kimchii]
MNAAAAAGAPEGDAQAPQDPFPLDVDALLLDMDGTLVDSGPSVERAWTKLFEEHGSNRTFDHTLHGMPARGVLADVFPDMPADEIEAAHARVEDLEVEDAKRISILPGTARLIGELQSAAEQLGRPTWTIVTSCTRRLFEARWAITDLPYPEETLVTADQVSRGKPDPEPYVLGAERLGADPSRALVIEDSLGGLASARAAGCPAIAVTTTTLAHELAPHAEALLTSLDDVAVEVHEGRLRVVRR